MNEIVKSLWKELHEINTKANWAFENDKSLDELSRKQIELIKRETYNINFKLNVLRTGGKVEGSKMFISLNLESKT